VICQIGNGKIVVSDALGIVGGTGALCSVAEGGNRIGLENSNPRCSTCEKQMSGRLTSGGKCNQTVQSDPLKLEEQE
jgi:hypothetical protein